MAAQAEGARRMDWQTLLAYITGTVDQALLLRHEYLVTENRILRHQITGRVRLSDGERKTLAEIGSKLGKQALEEVAKIVEPDTMLGWHRTLVAQKCDGSAHRQAPGRPPIDPELEALVVRMAQDNRSWGYDRIVGALANLGYTISDQTVGNILKRHGPPPGARAQDYDHMDRVHPHAHGRPRGDRLLHRRGLDAGRAGDLLRPLLHPPGGPAAPSRAV